MERESRTISIQKGYTNFFEKYGTSVLSVDFEKVSDTYLGDAYPNPSHNRTTFTFELVKKSRVRLEIFNSTGGIVKVLVDYEMTEGFHSIKWDNRTDSGYQAAPGIYYYRLSLDEYTKTRSQVIY